MMIIVEGRTFVDAHGVEVFSRWWPMDDPHGVVLVAHGASEHAGRYDRFARALNGAGFAVVALDHRGHGRTAPSTAPGVMGPGGGDAVVDDLHELRTEAASRFGIDVPVHLFGHSMGSLIALAYLTRHSEGLAASVLCGFPVDLDGAGPMGEALQAFAEAGLRDQPAESLLADNNKPIEPGRTSCPVLVIAVDQDPAAGMGAHPTALAEALRAAGVGLDLTLYEGARHELLNETNREEVTADVIAWLRARPPAP
jgi:alpha-beta hydrolase superfamily lysophospholipase